MKGNDRQGWMQIWSMPKNYELHDNNFFFSILVF